MSFVRTLTATAILTTVGAALAVVPATAAPVSTVQITELSSASAAAKPADLTTICVSSDAARADDSCRDGERRVALRVDRPVALCRTQDGRLSGGRCGDGEFALTLPRNQNALLCAAGNRGRLSLIDRRSECGGSVFRAINHVPGRTRRLGGPVPENSGRVSVGVLDAKDIDLGDRLTFRLGKGKGDDDNDLFQIRGDELFLTESVTFAEHPTLSVRVQTLDLLGKRLGRAMSIRVVPTPVSTPTPTATPTATPTSTPTTSPTATPTTTPPTPPAQPTTFDLAPTTVPENAVAKVGDLTIADPTPASAPVFTITSGGADLEIRNSTEVWTKHALDHEATPTVPVTIKVTDNGGLVDLTRSFTIDVTDVDEDPTAIELDGDTVAENAEALVGTLSVDDPDADSAPVYSITAGGEDLEVRNDDELWSTGLDFETDPTRTVSIHAGGTADLDEDFELTVTDVNEAPTALDLSATTLAENEPSGTEIGTLSSTDPDAGDTAAYTLVSGAADNTLFAITGDKLVTAADFDFETTPSATVRVEVADADGETFAKTFTVTVTNVNEAPATLTLADDVVAEHQPIGTAVGDLDSTDPDAGDTRTFTLVAGTGDDDNATFTIDGNTVKTAAVLDEATKNSYTIRVRVSDADGLDREATFTITVDPINDAPTALSLSATDIDENAVDLTVGTFSAIDTDGPSPFTYDLVTGAGDTNNGTFTITGNQLIANSAFDFEAKASYDIRVRVSDGGTPAEGLEKTFTITVTDVNEAPTALTLADSVVPEHQPVGTPVGDLDSTDPDAGDTATYTLVAGTGSADNATFTIDGNTVETAAVLDEATRNSYTIRVRVTDADGLDREAAFTITVDAINDAPTALSMSSTSIAENAADDATVGTFSVTDTDGLAPYTYELVSGTGDADNAAFTIVGNTLTAGSAFNFEVRSTYDVRVRVTDSGSPAQSFDKPFTITVTNVNEAPTALTLSAATVAENAANGTAIGTLASTDPDAGDTAAYSLVAGAADNAKFAIVNSQLVAKPGIDFESTPTLTARVAVTDAGGLQLVKSFDVTVTNVNEAPTTLTLSNNSVDENVVTGTQIGTLSSTDPDAADTATYSLVPGANDNTRFAIAGGKLVTADAFDREATPTAVVLLRVTDAGGLALDKSFTITINNVNEAPTALTLTGTSLPENSGAGATVGTFTTTDADGPSPYAYDLVTGAGSADNASFSISGDTLVTNADFDFETRASYTIRAGTTDADGLSYEGTFTVTVTNVNEAPATLTLTKSDIDENLPAATTVGVLGATDPDAGSAFTVALAAGTGDVDNAAFTVTGTSLIANSSFNFEARSSYSVRVRVTDNGTPARFREQPFTITVNDVNDAPTVGSDSYGTAIGNTRAKLGTIATTGPVVSLSGSLPLVNDSDQDAGDTLSVVAGTLSGSQGGSLTITSTGEFTYLPEVGDKDVTDTFTYSVTDGEATTTGSLAVLVGARRIWWVDDSATAPGNGTSASPYTSLTPLNASTTDPDAANDQIFVYAGSYTEGIALEQDQSLLGERNGLPGLVPAGFTPTITVGGTAAAIGLADGVFVDGLFAAASGTGPAISSVGTRTATVGPNVRATGGTGYAVDISNTGSSTDLDINGAVVGGIGGAVRISNAGTGTIDFTAQVTQATAGNPRGIDVSGNLASVVFSNTLNLATRATDAVTFSGGGLLALDDNNNLITTTSGTGVNVGTGSGNLRVKGNVLAGAVSGQPIRVVNHGSGTLAVSATVGGAGITMSGSGASLDLTGRITLSTATNGQTGLTATGGGSITATDTGNVVSTSTGTAVNIVGTTIGAGNVVFRSVSSNGAPNGINLQGTGSGSLKVNGTGGTTCGGEITDGGAASAATVVSRPATAGCTGGTIQGSTGAGIRLVSTNAPVLRSLLVTGSAGDGIELSGVTGATVTDIQVTGSGDVGGEHGMDVTGGGTLAVQDSSVDNSYDADIVASSSATTTTVTVDNTFVTNAGVRGGPSGDGIQVNARASQRVDLTATDSVFEVNLGDHVQVSSTEDSRTNQTVLSRNRMETSAAAVALGAVGGGVVMAASGTAWSGTSVFTMTGNSIQGAQSSAITIAQSGSTLTGALRGTIAQNTIGGTGINSCAASTDAPGIMVRNRDGSGALTVAVRQNTISQCAGPAMWVRASGGTMSTDVTVDSNTIGATNGAAAQKAFLAELNLAGSVNSSCLDVVGNSQGGATVANSIELHSNASVATRIAGYTSGGVPAFLSPRNSNIPVTASGTYAAAGSTCATP